MKWRKKDRWPDGMRRPPASSEREGNTFDDSNGIPTVEPDGAPVLHIPPTPPRPPLLLKPWHHLGQAVDTGSTQHSAWVGWGVESVGEFPHLLLA